MQTKSNQRKDQRLKYKNTIQYEEYLGDERYGTPVATEAFDISARGLGFYDNKEFKLNSTLRISCYVSDNEKISFTASVVRLQIDKHPG